MGPLRVTTGRWGPARSWSRAAGGSCGGGVGAGQTWAQELVPATLSHVLAASVISALCFSEAQGCLSRGQVGTRGGTWGHAAPGSVRPQHWPSGGRAGLAGPARRAQTGSSPAACEPCVWFPLGGPQTWAPTVAGEGCSALSCARARAGSALSSSSPPFPSIFDQKSYF